ncbi:putative coronin [Toxoplasma gondii VEG]|uniref:Coronin n=1 Tax=Toxoplasma gondii (strain ATCC 50861 / VEG) TaxID=432359 RepID=B9QNF7_TOXGV|nr:putative coronin [Toxoplasma gondii VEG]CEL77873.1 TPA: coronin, putative [Toxoplasma gondii VEG]
MADAVDVPLIKNLYAEAWKQQYSDLRLSTKQTESCGLAANTEYIAAPWDVGGGGVLGILRLADIGRNPAVAKIKGHTASIQDTNFSPFHRDILATACEDTIVRIWQLPEEVTGTTELKEPIATLTGALKKVLSAEWNPAVSGILASGCFDGTVAFWNVEKNENFASVKFQESLLSAKWSWKGDLLACTTKDKALNIVDPRAAQVVGSVACHDGSKACKCTWIDGLAGRDGHVFTTGFGKMQEREMAIWDTRKFDKPVYHAEIDRGSSPLYPIFDETTGMLYVCGKGDSSCRYYQYHGGTLRSVDAYRSSVPIKNFCFIPKLAVDQMRAEIGRMLKQENGNVLQPISFIVPRKNQDVFQADLYPPAPDVEPSMTAEEWFKGENKAIRRRSVKPGDVVSAQPRRMTVDTACVAAVAQAHGAAADSQALQELQSEVASLKAQLTELDRLCKENEELKANGGDTAALLQENQELKANAQELETLRKENAELKAKIKELSAQSAMAVPSTSEDPQLKMRVSELAEALSNEKSTTAQLEARLRDLEGRFISAAKSQKAAEQEAETLKERVQELEAKNRELKTQMEQAHGTLHRAATLSGLDSDMKNELNEMRDFFRDILHQAQDEAA